MWLEDGYGIGIENVVTVENHDTGSEVRYPELFGSFVPVRPHRACEDSLDMTTK